MFIKEELSLVRIHTIIVATIPFHSHKPNFPTHLFVPRDFREYLVDRVGMTRKRSYSSLYPLDPEIKKTLNRIRKTKHMHCITEIDNFEMKPDFSDNPLYEPDPMENNNNRTLKELVTPYTYEFKSGLIHLLPKFHGLAIEGPHKHLKEFHVVFSMIRPQGIPKDYIKMKVFPFSLNGETKDWLYLQSVMCTTWGDTKQMFLEKFFLTSRTAAIQKERCGICQHLEETLQEYWERFNKLRATCPHH
ncbi:hypothetical protein CR513_19170, partial [Mucuna pruriens]